MGKVLIPKHLNTNIGNRDYKDVTLVDVLLKDGRVFRGYVVLYESRDRAYIIGTLNHPEFTGPVPFDSEDMDNIAPHYCRGHNLFNWIGLVLRRVLFFYDKAQWLRREDLEWAPSTVDKWKPVR